MTGERQPATWIIGQGGLLGSALARRVPEAFRAGTIPWPEPAAARAALTDALRRFGASCGDRSWQVLWVAGQATTSSADAQTMTELDTFRAFVATLRTHGPSGPGAFFLASSAGGIYAGSAPAPFTDHSVPAPLSGYGRLKLAQEAEAQELAADMPVVIGRIANIYGPGQDLTKPQGLISRLALSAVTHQPLRMFVHLDTLRDYVYADDAAAAILAHLALARQEVGDRTVPGSSRIRIIASGQATSLAHLIRLTQAVGRSRIPIAFGSHPSGAYQSPDLRLVPSTDSGLRQLPATSLVVGIRSVIADVRARYQEGPLRIGA